MLTWAFLHHQKQKKEQKNSSIRRSTSDSDLSKAAGPTLTVKVVEASGTDDLPKGGMLLSCAFFLCYILYLILRFQAHLWVTLTLEDKTEQTKPVKLEKKSSPVQWDQTFTFDVTTVDLDTTPLRIEVFYWIHLKQTINVSEDYTEYRQETSKGQRRITRESRLACLGSPRR